MMLTWKPTWNDGNLLFQCLESPNPSGDIEFQQLYSTSALSTSKYARPNIQKASWIGCGKLFLRMGVYFRWGNEVM